MRENLKATKSFTYAGRALKAGDAFSAVSGDARVLRAVGRAQTYETAQAFPEITKDATGGGDGQDAPTPAAAPDVAGAPSERPEAPARKPRAKKESAK